MGTFSYTRMCALKICQYLVKDFAHVRISNLAPDSAFHDGRARARHIVQFLRLCFVERRLREESCAARASGDATTSSRNRAIIRSFEDGQGMADGKQVKILKEEGVAAWNKWSDRNPAVKLDFIRADLRGADLRGASLRHADFSDASLDGADLDGADLRTTDFRGAKLSTADLSRANLIRADLSGADLIRAKLRRRT
jgi:uncharacterized protein YjbI with pentapeptide repeats